MSVVINEDYNINS